jgi:hypothetical protein
MLANELYSRDPIKGYQLIGVLPEGRRVPKRISKESVFLIVGKNISVIT